MIAPDPQTRRAISALYRALHNEGEPQYRALERLQYLVSEEFAFDVWLSTKPDPKLVEQVNEARLKLFLSRSPLHNMKVTTNVFWPVEINRWTTS